MSINNNNSGYDSHKSKSQRRITKKTKVSSGQKSSAFERCTSLRYVVHNDLRMRTYTKLTCAESTCTLDTEHGLPVNRNRPEAEEERVGDYPYPSGNIIERTVAVLSYEIEPSVIEEFLAARRVSENQEEVAVAGKGSISGTIESVRTVLLPIIRNPDSEEHRAFCDFLRERIHEHYLADLMEVIGAMVRMRTEDQGPDDGEKRPQCLCCNGGGGSSVLRQGQSRSFDLDLIYVDRETRKIRSFEAVTSQKRRRRRKSRSDSDHVTTETAPRDDRCVPMLSVRLYSQCLCEVRVRRLQRIIEAYPCVRDLSLVRTPLQDSGKLRLCLALEQNVGLYGLDLSRGNLGDDGAMFLSVALRSNRHLRTLNLTNSDLTGAGCALLVKGLALSRALTDLNLSFNAVGDRGCVALAGLLTGNQCHLRRLKLRSNGVTWRGAVAIFASLRKNSRLRLLDLSGNDVTDASLDVLRDSLACNRALTDLSLDGCGLTKRGCHVISKALRTNQTLRSLSLSMNSLGDIGVRRLAEGLAHNRSLAEISLNMCEISNAGFSHILDAIRSNFRMRTVRLCYNLIDIDPDLRRGKIQATGNDVRRDADDVIASSDDRRSKWRDRRIFASRNSFPFVGSDVIFARDSEFFDGDAVSVDDVSGSELRAKLTELLDANPSLKLFLWGNRIGDVNFRLSVTISSQDSIDYL